MAKTIDAEWVGRRAAGDVHLTWRWVDLTRDTRESFVVFLDDVPVAIWASKTGSPVTLDGHPYYRLDYVELDPDLRGDGQTSVMLFALIARRASELGAEGIVLSAFNVDKLINTYEILGATRGNPSGWKWPKELVPLTFYQGALDSLRELTDGFEEDPSKAIP